MNLIDPSKQFDLKGFYVEITSRCNLRCLHCYNESGELKNEIDFKTFKKLVDEFPTKPTITISGGEPLTHPQIWEMLEYCKDKVTIDSVMITNGTLITKEIARKITESGIGIQISLNGINAEQHDSICGKGNYERTLNGLHNLLEVGNKKIIVRGMISKLNVADAEKFILKWGEETGNVAVSFLATMGRGKSIEKKIDLDIFQKNEILVKLNNSKLIEELKSKGRSVGIPKEAFSFVCPFIIKSDEKTDFAPRIDSSGNIFLCQNFDGREYALGNVYKETLHEMLTSKRLEEFINFFLLSLNFKESCTKCVFKSNCGKGCIANAASRGSAQKDDGSCALRKVLMADTLMAAGVSE